MEMGKVKRYPLDFDTLKRGMWIEAEELEEAIGCGLNHPNVNLRILALCQRIKLETGILCRQEKMRLRLMTHGEADVWTYNQVRAGVAATVRNAKARQMVDHNDFEPHQRQAAESRDRIAAAVATAARSTLRQQERMEKLTHRGPLPSLPAPGSR